MKLNENLAKLYYSAGEARKVLGLDDDSFQNWARTDRIKRIYLPGRKHPVYSKQEINNIAIRTEAKMLAEGASGLIYKKATVNDIDAEVELASLVFGARAGLPEAVALRKSYLEKNPNTTYHLYDGDFLSAYINLIPFKNEAIEEFKEGKRGWLLGVDNIEQFEEGKPLECVIIDLASTPTVSPARRGTYGQILLEKFSETLKEWGENGITINKVYAASNTPSGIRIIKHAGFTTLQEVSKGRFTFELDIEKSATRLLIEYKEALQKWTEKKESNNTKTKSKRSRRPMIPNVGEGVSV